MPPSLANLLHGFAVIALAVAAAVLYGVLHDQVTARVCIEYFTIGHDNLLGVDPHTADPTVQGLLWGVIATWWFGLILGIPGSILSRVGGWPRLSARDLAAPIAVLLCLMGVAAAGFGITGAVLAATKVIWLVGPLASEIPVDRHAAFLACGWAHGASYLVGGLGGVVLWVWILVTRWRRGRAGV